MLSAFVIWSIVAVLFFGIGIKCRKSQEAVGFFTCAEPSKVKNVKKYNQSVSKLWIAGAVLFEAIGIPLLFIKQNSPIAFVIILEVMVWAIAMMIVYIKIEAEYKK